MHSKTSIRLAVCDAGRAASFYEALLGAPATKRDDATVTFEVDSPPLHLVIERSATPPRAGRDGARLQFSLCVNQPQHVGEVAIALRRAGVRLRLEDKGVEAHDPDGNAWSVRFVPNTKKRSVVAASAPVARRP